MRYVCIHGHFYQPPRENPWLDTVEVQDSAAPYHDWNERITAECYWPNAASRLLGHGNRITAIVNNFSSISFNIGPTLCSWFARHESALLRQIVEADRLSCQRHQGHGNAIAQAYGHAILPLCDARDKTTQVSWGVRDFVHRFGRSPEGMWLPETAVDLATLEALAEQNLSFTILAPHQAKRIRPIGQALWRSVSAEQLDTTRPYLCRLPSGKTIALFFYHGGLARGVAFDGLLNSGDRFAEQLMKEFSSEDREPRLVHLATDGESYGHHHRFGEMALAFAVHDLERRNLAQLTNYGEFLALAPPQWEVEIAERTSWSCAHGVERWRDNCGCHIGGASSWTQAWRAPLRTALNWLRDEIDKLFERFATPLLADPWEARNAYIELLLNQAPDRIDAFCAQYERRELSPGQKIEVCKLLEMQRHRLLMFTSCGWFFDELSGIEGIQILQYAARAAELAEAFGATLEPGLIERLRRAPSNLPEWGDGGRVYRESVKPHRVDARRIVANHAICSVLEPARLSEASPAAFSLQPLEAAGDTYGTTALSVGRAAIASRFTGETAEYVFAVLKLTNHDVHGVVSEALPRERFLDIRDDLLQTFARHSLSEVVRALDRSFGEQYYTAKDLLLDDRRRVLAGVSDAVLTRLEDSFRQVYQENRRLMEYLRELDVPLPQGFALAAGFLASRALARAATGVLEDGKDGEELVTVMTEARKWRAPLETAGVEERLRRAVEERLATLVLNPLSPEISVSLHLLELAERLGLTFNVWKAQTLFAQVCRQHLSELLKRRHQEEAVAQQILLLKRLGEKLGFYAVNGLPLETWDQG